MCDFYSKHLHHFSSVTDSRLLCWKIRECKSSDSGSVAILTSPSAKAILQENTAENQLKVLTVLVNTVVIGNCK